MNIGILEWKSLVMPVSYAKWYLISITVFWYTMLQINEVLFKMVEKVLYYIFRKDGLCVIINNTPPTGDDIIF